MEWHPTPKIPWMEEPGRLQSMGSLRVRHDLEAINKELSRHESNSQQAIIMEFSCEESCCSAA